VLRVRIRDNGRGIDPKVLKEGGIAGHWGLRGVRERAERTGAQLEFWSEAGAGTEVQLTVPASVAYENSHDGVRSRLLRKVRNHGQHS
jgi:signal transduction histidine kinase